MNNREESNSFNYTYSAKEQEEIKRIRQKYQTDEEDGIDKLRRLDAKVSRKATVVALVFGVVGALIMGSGMSLLMSDLGIILGMQNIQCIILGVITGLLGMALIALAYPIYSKVLKKEREKVAPEILRLTEELMK